MVSPTDLYRFPHSPTIYSLTLLLAEHLVLPAQLLSSNKQSIDGMSANVCQFIIHSLPGVPGPTVCALVECHLVTLSAPCHTVPLLLHPPLVDQRRAGLVRNIVVECRWTMSASRAPWAPRVLSHVDGLLDSSKLRALSPPRESAPSRCGQRRKQFVRIASARFHRADSTRRNSLSLLPYSSQ